MSCNTLTCNAVLYYSNIIENITNKTINLDIIKTYCPDDYYHLSNMCNKISNIKDKTSNNYMLSVRLFTYLRLNAFKKAIDIKFSKMTEEQLNVYLLLENPNITNNINPNFDLSESLYISEAELDLYLS